MLLIVSGKLFYLCKTQLSEMKHLLFSTLALSLLISSCGELYKEHFDEYKSSLSDQVTTPNPFETNLNPLFLEDDDSTTLIKKGYAIVTETYKYLGPESNHPLTGNHLACKSCHLQSGTKPYSAPYVGVTNRFPNFRNREGRVGSIQDRINGCMERSMNGKKLADDAEEMVAIVAYMAWLSRDTEKNNKIKGKGFLSINLPDRAVNLDHGKEVFDQHCVVCHGHDGQGQKLPDADKTGGYLYPPLWGADSYNHGAGMNRVITAAQFIKGNMPFGTSADNPILSDEEAYDVAGYIDSFDRPLKENTEADFPDKKLKPVSTPYPPYADTFSLDQHKYGPYPPIIEFYKEEYNIVKKK